MSFNALGSSCQASPCAYSWWVGLGEQPPTLVGGGEELTLSFPDAGSEEVRLLVTDADGRTATAEHQLTIVAPEAPPRNMALPEVLGAAVQGETLTASPGSWSGSPSSFAYQWQACTASGRRCVNIPGAELASYEVEVEDVGHTLRVAITASNEAGSADAASPRTPTVTAEEEAEQEQGEGPSEGGGEAPDLGATGCFENPEEGTPRIEACGYPGLHNTGPEAGKCCSRTIKGSEFTSANTPVTIEGARIEGEVLLREGARDVHLVNDEIIASGQNGQAAVRIERGAEHSGADEPTGTVVDHDILRGTERRAPGSLDECLISYSAGELHAEYDSFTFCGGIKPTGGGVIAHDFCDMSIEIEGEHSECISDDGEEPQSPLIIDDNTLFNPKAQTASIFLQGHFFPVGEVVVEDNFLAGGDYIASLGGGDGFGITGPEIWRENRFARACPGVAAKEEEFESELCGPAQAVIPDTFGPLYELCTTRTQCSPTLGAGYYPRGGSKGVFDGVPEEAGVRFTWQENFFDDDHEECAIGHSVGKACW